MSTPAPNARTAETKQLLMDATVRVLRDRGLAGLSARNIGTEAGVNQALVFYHFETVDGLVEQACRALVEQRVALHRDAIAAATTVSELLQVGRNLHLQERAAGTVAVSAQALAGGQSNPTLAAVGKYALDSWSAEISNALRRLLAGTPVEDLADIDALGRAVSAGFIGLELYDGVDPEAAESAMAALENLAVLLDVLTDLGPIARKALRARMRKSVKT